MFPYAYYAYISYKQTSFVRSISLNLLWYFEIWNHKKKVKNERHLFSFILLMSACYHYIYANIKLN